MWVRLSTKLMTKIAKIIPLQIKTKKRKKKKKRVMTLISQFQGERGLNSHGCLQWCNHIAIIFATITTLHKVIIIG